MVRADASYRLAFVVNPLFAPRPASRVPAAARVSSRRLLEELNVAGGERAPVSGQSACLGSWHEPDQAPVTHAQHDGRLLT